MYAREWAKYAGDFLIHGDLWSNNVLFDRDDIKAEGSNVFVNWQCLATGNPFVDFGNIGELVCAMVFAFRIE